MISKSGAVMLAVMGLCFITQAHGADRPGHLNVTTITIDPSQNRHRISPLIYGASFADKATVLDLRIPIDRSGGDNASTYNWTEDAINTGHDWYYESRACNPNVITDQYGLKFAGIAFSSKTIPMITIPYGGWIARLGLKRGHLSSFSVSKYGPQRDYDQWLSDAGNGIKANGLPIRNNDPFDAQMPDLPESEIPQISKIASLAKSAPHYYILDNEPDAWHIAHHDVHPEGAHAHEIAAGSISMARMIRHADPKGIIVGPESWGWSGYFNSSYDQQTGTHSDRNAQMDGMDFIPWLLMQWKASGYPVDVFSLHYYPQSGEYSDDDSPATEHARNVSTRDLWDKGYHNPTWINDNVALIPRMREWVSHYYRPQTPIALTEYSWGGDDSMNGATAEADVLGILGREGMDIANRWMAPRRGTPVYLAMKLFRNYDGRGNGFGETSILSTTPDPDHISSFAAIRKDGIMTVIAINKDRYSACIDIKTQGKPWHPFRVIRLSQGRMIQSLMDSRKTQCVEDELPPQSVSLYELRG